MERALLEGEWKTVREGIEVKIVPSPKARRTPSFTVGPPTASRRRPLFHDRFE
jgi:hypothetical protein